MIITKNNKYIYIILISIFCLGGFFVSKNFIFASETDHIVISEVQISGEDAYDEFVELYNPTNFEVNISGWKLQYKSDTGITWSSKVGDGLPFDSKISPYGFFLLAGKSYNGITNPGYRHSVNWGLGDSAGHVRIINDDGEVDVVGYGESANSAEGGNPVILNLDNNQSMERINIDGLIQDTNNNGNDFILQLNPNPQNSNSTSEPYQNELPVVNILSPENNSVYTEDEVINFKAGVSDLEDGMISNENIVWKNGDVELGKGNEIEVKNLAVGSYIITLEVQDSGGGKTEKEIIVEIISAQNDENSGEESENSDGQNSSSQENETSGNQVDSSLESAAGGANGSRGSSSSSSGATSIVLPKIIITEFLPDPEDSDRDNEFIEIYNNGEIEVDLSGLELEDKAGKTKKFAIPNEVKLKPKKYKVFYSDETGIALNNSGDGVVLIDNKNNIINETPICGAAKEDVSYALGEDGGWAFTLRPTPGRKNIIETGEKSVEEKDDKKQGGSTAIRDNGASGEEISSPENEANEKQYDFSDKIIISEIYPNPKGKDNAEENYEWIELYNNSDEDVNLKGWQIDDVLKKGSRPYIVNEDEIIKAGSHRTLDNAETKLILNNSGDEINLIWPDGTIIDTVSYEKSIDGESYNLSDDDSWFWSYKITPGTKNKAENKVLGLEEKTIFQDTQVAQSNDSLTGYFEDGDNYENYSNGGIDYIETNIKDLEHFIKYTKVKISGIISTPPVIFSDKSFYVYGSGIQVYSYQAQIPKLELGDYVEIIGRISEIGGEKRILLDKTEDVKVIYRLTEPRSEIISTGSVGEETEGWLATVEGRVSEIFEDVFFVDDGSGKVKIYIKSQTGIKKPDIKIGDWVVVTGQVSQTSAGYRILPRFQRDIKVSETKEISTTITDKNSRPFYDTTKNDQGNKTSAISFLFLIAGLIILVDWGKMKIKK